MMFELVWLMIWFKIDGGKSDNWDRKRERTYLFKEISTKKPINYCQSRYDKLFCFGNSWLSEEAIVEVFAEPAQNLLINRFRMPDLTFCFAKLDVCRGCIWVLRLVEFVAIFKLLFKDGQIRPTLLQRIHVLPCDLRSNLWTDKRGLLTGLLYRW